MEASLNLSLYVSEIIVLLSLTEFHNHLGVWAWIFYKSFI